MDSIDAEVIRDQLDAAGQGVQDFADILVNQLSKGARASADSAANAFSNLGNATFELQAAIGEGLNPIVRAATVGLTGFIESITDAIQGTTGFTEVLADLNAELARASGGLELRVAVEGGVDELEEFIRLTEIAIDNTSVFFGARERAILLSQLNEARDALAEITGLQNLSLQSEQELRAELVRQEVELERIQGLQTDRNNLIAEQGPSARRASRIYLEELDKQDIAINANIDDLEDQLQRFEDLRGTIGDVGSTAAAAEIPTRGLITTTENLTGVLAQIDTTQFLTFAERGEALSNAIRPLPSELSAVRGEFDALFPTADRVNAIFTEFNETLGQFTIKPFIISLVDAQEETETLSEITRQLIQDLQDLEGLADARSNIGRRTDPHNANLVNPDHIPSG